MYEGKVLYRVPSEHDEKVCRLVNQLERHADEVIELLLAERGADAANLLRVWKGDQALRDEWPGGITGWIAAGESAVARLLDLQTSAAGRE